MKMTSLVFWKSRKKTSSQLSQESSQPHLVTIVTMPQSTTQKAQVSDQKYNYDNFTHNGPCHMSHDPLSSIQEDVGRPAGQDKADHCWQLVLLSEPQYRTQDPLSSSRKDLGSQLNWSAGQDKADHCLYYQNHNTEFTQHRKWNAWLVLCYSLAFTSSSYRVMPRRWKINSKN